MEKQEEVEGMEEVDHDDDERKREKRGDREKDTWQQEITPKNDQTDSDRWTGQ